MIVRITSPRSWIAAGAVLLTSTTDASGISARNLAMGGAGVASSHYDAASRANPALLTRFREGDHFSVSLPVASGEVSDQDDVIDELDGIAAQFRDLERYIDDRDYEAAMAAGDQILDALARIDESPVLAALGAGASFARPGKHFAFAIDVRSFADGGVVASYDPGDAALIAAAIVSGETSALEDIQSFGLGLGTAVSEVVFSMATEWQLPGGHFSLGVAPKYQRVDTALYVARANEFDSDDIDLRDLRNDDAAFNLDVGAAWGFAGNWQLGLMVRDLVARDYATLSYAGYQSEYHVSPNATLGIAYNGRAFTVAIDGDLNERNGYDELDSPQFLSLGAEFNAADWVQLRAGYRHDAGGGREDIATLGLGISPFDIFHIDLTGFFGREQAYGGALELYLTL